jgi:hypothetical protein
MSPLDDQVLDSILRGAEEMDELHRPKNSPTWHKTTAKFLVAVILFIPRFIIAVFKLLFSLVRRTERHPWE